MIRLPLPSRLRRLRRAEEHRTILVVLSHPPYDGTDVTWNALRFADVALDQGHRVRVFVMNDAIDIVREGGAPEGAEFDLLSMLRRSMAKGARVKVCTTCVNRCGLSRAAIARDAPLATMGDLVQWVAEAERVVTF